MKHITRISQSPKQGAEWQEILCMLAVTLNMVMGAFGGAAPFTQFIEEKCDIPQNT